MSAADDRAPANAPGVWRLGYRPALDGIRAVAVLAVLGFHTSTAAMKGGFIGVDIFFVLSGFLITALLVQEWRDAGRVGFVDFYSRRARRLLPALFVTLVGVGVIYAVLPSLHTGLPYWSALIAVVFYAGNWVASFAHNPVAVLALLDHTWSLAIEEQFYIVWPLLLLVPLRRFGLSRHILILGLILSCASAAIRALLFVTDSPSHIYFRTDAHADGLLLGCTLAIACSTDDLRCVLRRYVGHPIVPVVAAVGLLGFALRVGINDDFVFLGGLSLAALAAAVLVGHVAVRADSLVVRLLAQRSLVWLGARSYGVYLFHIPIFGVVGYELADITARVTVPLEVGLTIIVATMSFRWVESPFMRRRHLAGAPSHVQRAPAESRSKSSR